MNDSSSNAGGVGGLGDNGTGADDAAENSGQAPDVQDTHVQQPAPPSSADVQDSFGANPAAGGPTAPDPGQPAAHPSQPAGIGDPNAATAQFGAPGQAGQPGQPGDPNAAGAGAGQHLGPGPTPPPNWSAPADTNAFPPYAASGTTTKKPMSTAKQIIVAAVLAGLIGGGIGTGVTYAIKDNGSSSSASQRSPVSTNNAALTSPGSVSEVAAAVMPSVVDIQVSNSNGSGDEGTGIVYSSDGLIVTNNHVVASAAGSGGGTITVTFNDGKTATAKIVGAEPRADLAVIKADGVSNLTKATFGVSKDLKVGQSVVAIGSPLGLSSTVTSGIVSALNRPVETQSEDGQTTVVLDAIQTDAAINPGNSGGPLVDMQGNVIGINSAIASNSQSGGLGGGSSQAGSIGLGFAIPISEALPIVDQLAQGQQATIASLGVQQPAGSDTTTRTSAGYKVAQVAAGGPADKAGLKAGDVISKVGDRLVYSYADVAAAVRSHRPGDQVTITYTRGGSQSTANVTLGTLAVQPAQ
jgi:putative serine protease PepD